MASETYESNSAADIGFPVMVGILIGGLLALVIHPILAILGGIAVMIVLASLRPEDGTRLPHVQSVDEQERIEAEALDAWDGEFIPEDAA